MIKTNRFVLLVLAGFAAGLGSAVPAAQAQGLLEHLFGGGMRQREPVPEYRSERPPAKWRGRSERRAEHRPRRQQPQRAARKAGKKPAASRTAAAAPKILAPSYYVYKPDGLVSVDFAPLSERPQAAAFEPALAGATFRDALQGLQGFELNAEKEIAQALVTHYQAEPDFIWVSGFHANGRAEEALRVLGEAESFGLSAADYSVAVPPAAFSLERTAERLQQLIRFEMTLSARVLRYVRDAYRGRIDPNRLSGYHDFPAKPLELAKVLNSLARIQDVKTYLESRHPQNAEYQALRGELEALRASPDDDVALDVSLLLKPGMKHPDLPKILALIGRQDSVADQQHVLSSFSGGETYAPELVPVVKAAQTAIGLKPDGVIGPRTLRALTGFSKEEKLEKVTLALERLRWHPSELGGTRVFINQPAFRASYFEQGREKLDMAVVIGTKANQTSFFFDEIEQVDFNPYWGVPQSILVNEMLPRLRRDPGYLDRAGYEVRNAKGRRIPSASINWSRYGAKIPYSVRQTPSEANALGELKILFPNKHAIYMHDTPQKSLFNRDVRAFSHGCVRLADPRGMAAAVLGRSVGDIETQLKKGHSSARVSRKIPVYVAYFTAWPNAAGKVEYYDDIYDRDARLAEAVSKTDEVRVPSI